MGTRAPESAEVASAGAIAFYASRVDECWVGSADGSSADERVEAQAGDFYGG